VALSKEQVERISEDQLGEILEAKEKTIISNEKPVYREVSKICNKILRANKDIPEIQGMSWTIFLGNIFNISKI